MVNYVAIGLVIILAILILLVCGFVCIKSLFNYEYCNRGNNSQYDQI